MFKRYPILIAVVLLLLIAFLGHVSATYTKEIAKADVPVHVSIELEVGNFPFVHEIVRKNMHKNSVDKLKTFKVTKKLELPVNKPQKIKGIFITGWVAGIEKRMTEFIKLARNTEINAFVIDIKDDTGTVSYQSEVPQAAEINANKKKVKDMKALVQKLKDEKIYLIGRVVVFKDPILAQQKSDKALKLKKGEENWSSSEWVNPFDEENWKYVVDLAKEALDLGFDEIQFDYVRFPALGNGPTEIDYSHEKTREEAINGFLAYAQKELADYKAPISADIFGAVTSVDHDMGIGQKLESIGGLVDIVSPMVYPSHYAHGVFELPVPEAAPYETIYHSIGDAKKRMVEEGVASLRPWLQDFSLRYYYGPEEIRKQIKALADLGIEEWLLWNPRSIYTVSALLPEKDLRISHFMDSFE